MLTPEPVLSEAGVGCPAQRHLHRTAFPGTVRLKPYQCRCTPLEEHSGLHLDRLDAALDHRKLADF